MGLSVRSPKIVWIPQLGREGLAQGDIRAVRLVILTGREVRTADRAEPVIYPVVEGSRLNDLLSRRRKALHRLGRLPLALAKVQHALDRILSPSHRGTA